MEAEERPYKKRRLSQNEDSDAQEVPETANEGVKDVCAQKATTEAPDDRPLPVNDMEDKNHLTTNNVDPIPEENEELLSDNVGEDGLPPPQATAPLVDLINGNQNTSSMSKNQQKKLRKKLEWEAKREERKVIRKEKMVARRERRKADRQHAAEDGTQPVQPPVKRVKAPKPVTLPVTILIDCDFDDLMRDNERISLAAQITRSYSDNKNSMFRAHLAVCSFEGKLRDRFDNILTHYKSWRGVRFLGCDFVEAAEKAKDWMLDDEDGGQFAGTFSNLVDENEENLANLKQQGEIVYLSSEADETLTGLNPYSTYIIGGLVDKNREKGICYKRATKRGVRTAKLPIGEFMDMQSRKVLATNHVNEIMLRWLECGDWGEAFTKVIPKRKGGKLKARVDEEDDLKQEGEEAPLRHDDGLFTTHGTDGVDCDGISESGPDTGEGSVNGNSRMVS